MRSLWQLSLQTDLHHLWSACHKFTWDSIHDINLVMQSPPSVHLDLGIGFFIVVFWDRVSNCPQTHFIAEDDREQHLILLLSAWFMWRWESSPGFHVCQASTLSAELHPSPQFRYSCYKLYLVKGLTWTLKHKSLSRKLCTTVINRDLKVKQSCLWVKNLWDLTV